jgi:hypothetical protein
MDVILWPRFSALLIKRINNQKNILQRFGGTIAEMNERVLMCHIIT